MGNTFKPVRCEGIFDEEGFFESIGQYPRPENYSELRARQKITTQAILHPLPPKGYEWVCVPKRKPSKAKRKGTRKESSK